MLTFQELYETYINEVYRFALWMTADRFEAEDIASETIIRAWAKHGKIRTETLKVYLFTIARNFYFEKKRKEKRWVELDDTMSDPFPGPEKTAESNHRIDEVQKFLKTIPEIDRVAFIMRVQHELPYEEIARALEISVGNAKVKVHRIRKKLLVDSLTKEVS
jgi:RNA polymerase sigma-70 factor (ECF subfamily)